jgi:hypothetical protein
MGLSPRIVTEDVTFLWDGVTQRLPKGQLIDVEPGGALERAIGSDRLVPYGLPPAPVPMADEASAVETVTPAEADAPPEDTPPLAPPKIAPPAGNQDAAPDGDW